MLKFLLSIAVALCSINLTVAAQAGERLALVVGNSQYVSGGSLVNPERDARAIARKLGSLGFQVVEGYNLGYDELRDVVRSFARETQDAELIVFYYAGHGVAIDNVNYVVPVDAQMNDAVDWEFEVYALPDILRVIARSDGASLIFLDACRDNPMAQKLGEIRGMSTRSLSTRGIAPVEFDSLGTTGSIIAYATEPGQVALDGDGDNSPFTTALLNHIGNANTDFAAITSLITRDVLAMTDGTQRPRFDVSLTGPLVLNKVETVVAASATTEVPETTPAASSGALEVEKIVFDTARETGDRADYQAYLDAYPNGAFAVLARNAIVRLQQESGAKVTGSSNATTGSSGNELAKATLTYRSTDPLYLTVTPEARGIVNSKLSEDQMGMTKSQRKEVQLRLNLSGNNVGRPDGIFGRGTRGGISSWQAQAGYPVTGYFNATQHQSLVANTETVFSQHMATNPNALVAPTFKRSSSKRSKKSSQVNNAAVGAFLGGIATGILLGK